MKIEMAESLFYSWLRHAKGCQMVQTNWKVSPSWTISNEFVIEQMFNELKDYFMKTYNYKVFNKNSLSQFIKQGECDVLGINVNCGVNQYYAVDVAFHSDGLNYGSYEKTIYKVISKCIRTAFCLYGFFEASEAEIVFASPKINPRELTGIIPLIQFINDYFTKKGFSYKFRLIYGSDFELNVINPILIASDNVADTNELFIRSYQMLKLFENYKPQMLLVN